METWAAAWCLYGAVDDVIDENGLRQQLKSLTMLKTFVKVVAACVTPSYLRDRVEEQMKTVPANDLTWSSNKGTAMVQSVAVKKTIKDAALLSMQRKPTKLYETSGNSEEITHAHRTAAGPVEVPGKRRCYVVNDGDEILVSYDTLKTIAIDIDRLLELVARLQRDDDGDNLDEVGGDCMVF
ncbi:hypothetical protein DYB36_014332, partial [Aphanomyces astaci]